MPLQPYHVAAVGGAKLFFGRDIVDGWPIGPVSLVQNQTFYFDPHSDTTSRLRVIAQVAAGNLASGVAGSPVAPKPGTQNAWFRQNSGIPGQESI